MQRLKFFFLQRDDRDTAFAQAYLLKVKKVLRDDLDKYEKFLRLMYEFNKSGQSPVKVRVYEMT